MPAKIVSAVAVVEFGSMDVYVREGLGISDDGIENLRPETEAAVEAFLVKQSAWRK